MLTDLMNMRKRRVWLFGAGVVVALFGFGIAIGYWSPSVTEELSSRGASARLGGAPSSPSPGTCDAKADDIEGRWTIEQVQGFCKFQLYWLGESYQGLPLTRILRHRSKPPAQAPQSQAQDIVVFAYGSCDPGDDGGCPYPVVVSAEPYCSRPPSIFAEPLQKEMISDFRGVQALIVQAQVTFWTGNAKVDVFDHRASSNSDATQTAQQVGSVTAVGPKGGEQVPPVDVVC